MPDLRRIWCLVLGLNLSVMVGENRGRRIVRP
jgi:hypothetical protein